MALTSMTRAGEAEQYTQEGTNKNQMQGSHIFVAEELSPPLLC